LKKLILFMIINLSLLLALTSTPVFARAGGSMGSNGSSSSNSSTNTYNNDNYYRGYHNYNNYGINRLSLIDVVFTGFIGFSLFQSIKRRRQTKKTPSETYDQLTPKLNSSFEPFFYKVEDAWTKNDLETLKILMSPNYYAKQKRIINGYIRNHKIDQLDGLVIVELQQVVTAPDKKIQVIVTAQARDYFQFNDKSEDYNQQVQDDTNIERFTEIWTLKWQNENHLLLCNIQTIS